MRLLADVGVAQDTEALGIRGHNSVLDSIVDHLDEVAGAVRTAMQIPTLRGAAGFLAPRRTRDVPNARRQAAENRIETGDHRWLAADHHAVAALESPHSPAGTDIH